jgi:DNA-binding MarR family transcriptional regulator
MEAVEAGVRAASHEADGLDFGALTGMLGYQIRQTQTAVFRDFAATVGELDVSPGEFSLLALIDANPGTSQIRLTSAYKVDKSTLSLAIGRLVRRRLVRRTRSSADQRHYALWLDAEGRRLLNKVRAKVDAQEQTMAAALCAGEREQLLDMLRRITRALDR